MSSSGQNRIVLDWDGTLVEQAWPDHPPLMEGAQEALRELLAAGYELVVNSTRLAPYGLDERTKLPFDDRKREIDYIRRALDQAGLSQVYIWSKPWKPGALAYVDDKAIRFDGDWAKVLKEVLEVPR